jgi:hypothetical protein
MKKWQPLLINVLISLNLYLNLYSSDNKIIKWGVKALPSHTRIGMNPFQSPTLSIAAEALQTPAPIIEHIYIIYFLISSSACLHARH